MIFLKKNIYFNKITYLQKDFVILKFILTRFFNKVLIKKRLETSFFLHLYLRQVLQKAKKQINTFG